MISSLREPDLLDYFNLANEKQVRAFASSGKKAVTLEKTAREHSSRIDTLYFGILLINKDGDPGKLIGTAGITRTEARCTNKWMGHRE